MKRSQTIRINGQDVKVPVGLRPGELSNFIGLDKGHFFAEQGASGLPSVILNNNSPLPEKSDLNLIPLPRYVQGFDSRKARLQKEITIISHRFPILFDEENLSYLLIKDFPLNSNFNFRKTSILIKLPENYPFTAPQHWYLKKNLLYKGKSPEHYFQSAGFNDLGEDSGWSKFCLHTKSWTPTSDILSGDSLITFLELIKFVFDNLEREEV